MKVESEFVIPTVNDATIQKLATNIDMSTRQNSFLFKIIAGKAATKWRLLKDEIIEHKVLGYGVITKVCIGLKRRVIFIYVDFPCPSSKLKPGTAVFTPQEFTQESDIVDLTIPSKLSADVERLWQAIADIQKDQLRTQELYKKQLRKQEEWEEVVEQYKLLCTEAMEAITVIFNLPEVTEVDLKLVCKWSNLSYNDDLCIDDLKNLLRNSANNARMKKEFERLLSARLAERTVAKFYTTAGVQVKDLSAAQLENSQAGDWQHCDLQAGEKEIDVKNARRFYKNKNKSSKSYVELRVQKPGKVNPTSGVPVHIAGILSPYLELDHLLNHAMIPDHYVDRELIFLGINQPNQWEKLVKEFAIPGVLELDLCRPGLGSQRFLPKWMFDYPKLSYYIRDENLKKIRKILGPKEEDFWKAHPLNIAPCFLAMGIDYASIRPQAARLEWEDQFVQKVVAWRQHTSPSLPFVFLTVLWHFIKMTQQSNIQWHPEMYRSLLFYGKKEEALRWPLFVYDPQTTIHDLITALERLWQNHQTIFQEFRQFKLAGAGILRGRRISQERWQTLVAYCGNCHHHPLLWGSNDVCQECRKLICGCDFCSKDCPRTYQNMVGNDPCFDPVDEPIPF